MAAQAAIIGAGLGGLCAAVKLKEAGFDDLLIFEKADRVGGTWRDNSYPGCACDVPVSLYQFSFLPGLHWSRIYPQAAEVQAYAEMVADAFSLRGVLRLSEEATGAVWDEAAALWRITTPKGHYEARVLIAGLGQLNRPQLPNIEGRDTFAGPAFHSARWRHDVDLAGKRVGVIGSAASAVQLIPEVAKVAGHLSVFQRTPNWLIPRSDRIITDEEKALLFTEPEVAMRLGAAAREATYEQADHFFWQVFAWTKEGRAAYERIARDHLHAQVADPNLRALLTPNYPVGCKRILICDDFYPTLQLPHVELITAPIARIAPDGIVTGDGRVQALDVLVYATGFETTGWRWSMNVVGAGGGSLGEAWGDAPESYLGITVAGFPNLFMLYGPNTNLGHNSITFMIERQSEYIVQALVGMRDRQIRRLAPSASAQRRFNDGLQAGLAKTVWADPHCASWYKTADGRITQNWSSHTRAYAAATAQIDWADYEASAA